MKDKLEEYYIVSTFSSIGFGPLNKRQAKIRDHFVRTMEFLGLGDVDIDALTKDQRDEILALAAQRRKELDSSNPNHNPAAQSNAKERNSSPNKRQWDIRRGLNIKLYKALDALKLVIHDAEVLTQEQRGILYAELKRREKVKNSANSPLEYSTPSKEYEELETIYTSKPEPFVDVSSLLEVVAQTKPKTRFPAKSIKRLSGNNQATIGMVEEPAPRGEVKPRDQDTRKPSALCPHPYKRTFVTNELALDFIDKAHPNDKNIVPYPCQCGAIHIGHKK